MNIRDVVSESTYKPHDPTERRTTFQGPARHPKLRRVSEFSRDPGTGRNSEAGGHPVSLAFAWSIIAPSSPKCQVHSKTMSSELFVKTKALAPRF